MIANFDVSITKWFVHKLQTRCGIRVCGVDASWLHEPPNSGHVNLGFSYFRFLISPLEPLEPLIRHASTGTPLSLVAGLSC